jgi:hypothetical protein
VFDIFIRCPYFLYLVPHLYHTLKLCGTNVVQNESPEPNIENYEHHVGPNGKKIIADDLLVKKVFDEIEKIDYYQAVISNSNCIALF